MSRDKMLHSLLIVVVLTILPVAIAAMVLLDYWVLLVITLVFAAASLPYSRIDR